MSAPTALDSRVQELGKASRKAALLSLFGFLMVLGALAYSAFQLHQLEQERRTLSESLDSLKTERTKLEQEINQRKQDIATLDAWKEQLARANEALAATVRTTAPTSASRTALERAENARYAVGLYALGVSSDQYESVSKRLKDDGYVVSQEMLLSDRPPWLSRQSSVLYYDAAAVRKARSIADTLSRLTGSEIRVARGAGLAVLPGQERWTFFIHYIGR